MPAKGERVYLKIVETESRRKIPLEEFEKQKAEREQLMAQSVLHEAFLDDREPGPRDIFEAMTHTVPLAQLMDNQIAAGVPEIPLKQCLRIDD